MTFEDILNKLANVCTTDTGWTATCPACQGDGALRVGQGFDGRVILTCHEGCGYGQILAGLGVKSDDLAGIGTDPVKVAAEDGKKKKGRKPLDIIKTYSYQTPDSSTVYQVCVCKDGRSVVRVPDSKDPRKWTFGLGSHGVSPLPYRLPQAIAGIKERQTLWIVPSEKDVEAMEAMGFVATCAPGDHYKKDGEWKAEWCAWFGGARQCIVIARKDPAPKPNDVAAAMRAYVGQKRGDRIGELMRDKCTGARTFVLTLPDRGDTRIESPADWLNAGGTKEELLTAVKCAPPWSCPDALDALPAALLEADAASSLSSSVPPPDAPPAPPAEKKTKNVRGSSENPAAGGERGEDDCDDDTSICWLRAQTIGILTDKDATPFKKRQLLARSVVDWLRRRGRFFYHEDFRDHATSMYFDGKRKLLQLIESDYFKSWLARATAINRTSREFGYFEASVADEAVSGETTGIQPEMFWARRGDRIYMSSGDGQMVRISAGSVEMVDNGTDCVLFEHGKTLTPWQLSDSPEDPFEACSVFSSMACSAPHGRMLVKLWTIAMFGQMPCKPPLVFAGTVGSGKTKCATSIFELLGMIPRVSALNDMGGIKDFWTSVDAGGLVCFDNADTRIKWLPDALATVATNGTFEKKKLYTDTTTFVQYARCWCIVTSSNPSFASDAGLADRLIVITLDRVTRDTAESRLTREIHEHRAAGLTWIAHTLSKALADDGPIPSGLNRRHPDWAEMAYRIGRALGHEEDANIALTSAEAYKSRFSLENDVLGQMLLQAITQDWEGSTTDLIGHMQQQLDTFDPEKWTATKVGKIMEKMRPHLEAVFHLERKNHGGKTHYRFTAPSSEPQQCEGLTPTFEQSAQPKEKTATLSNIPLTTPNIVGGEEENLRNW